VVHRQKKGKKKDNAESSGTEDEGKDVEVAEQEEVAEDEPAPVVEEGQPPAIAVLAQAADAVNPATDKPSATTLKVTGRATVPKKPAAPASTSSSTSSAAAGTRGRNR
jgi:hypothetical protein